MRRNARRSLATRCASPCATTRSSHCITRSPSGRCESRSPTPRVRTNSRWPIRSAGIELAVAPRKPADARPLRPPPRAERRGAVRHVADRIRRCIRGRKPGGHPRQPAVRPERDRARHRRAGPRQAAPRAVFRLHRARHIRRPGEILRLQRAGDRPDPRAHARDARARERGDADRGAARNPSRALGGPEAPIGRRQDHHGGLDPGVLASDFLGRAYAHLRVFRVARLAADVGTRADRESHRDPGELPHSRGPAPSRPARSEPRALQPVPPHPADPLGNARGDAAGLRALRARQGPDRDAHRRRPRAQERARSGRHRGRRGVRLDDRVRRRHRVDIRVARHGQAPRRFDQRARPAGDRRLSVHRRDAVRRDQPRGRPRLLVARSASAGRRNKVTPSGRIAAEFAASRIALAGLALLALVLLAALLAPWISPQNPYDLARLDLLDSRLPPGARSAAGATYWLGTDDQGRDMLSAILYGLRTSVAVGFASTALGLAIGLSLGLASAWLGGWLDALLMRIADLQLSFPSILIALVLLAVLGQGLEKIIIALVAVQWAYYARTARAAALVERRKEYIDAAIALALSNARIIFRHLLPNCLPPLLVP